MTWPIKSSGETKNIKTTQNSNQVMHIISNILILPKGLFSCHMGTSLVSKKTGMERCDLWSYCGFYLIGYLIFSSACSKYSDRWGPGLGWCQISSTLWRDILTSPSLLLSRGNFMKDKDVQVDQSF